MARRPSVAPQSLATEDRALINGVLAGKRRALAKAITLIESTRADHQERAGRLLDALLPQTGKSLRIGLTGVPGVGKSTFIEAFGLYLIEAGKKVAVLAVDPSSSLSGGSILGDKTRMARLSQLEAAFIRPSPSAGALGGVAEKTREALLLCEAAGFDVVIVETVGVGQSETAVAGMTDAFVLLQLPNAGDELQGMKRGIMELADLIVINKADLDAAAAERAAQGLRSALALLHPSASGWRPPVLTVSAHRGQGIEAVWQALLEFERTQRASGAWEDKRRRQALAWMWQAIDAGLRHRFREHPAVRALLPELSRAVEAGETSPTAAAQRLLNLLNRYF
ncbi:MAG: methylmalonyl Co-A mutase-associated GTPase MeaB [Rhodocyclaceae bacterium]|nr:methylmalonyl Co-A mutase-associated GTPase MeaB [Rhodocyclaceae bacterium]